MTGYVHGGLDYGTTIMTVHTPTPSLDGTIDDDDARLARK